MEKETLLIIDPPNGYNYGFPKPMPRNVENVNDWLVENGYPKEIIDLLGEWFICRYWEELPEKK